MLKHIGSNEFNEEVLKSKNTVLVDFYADWCGPCKMLGEVLEETNFNILKVNVDDFQSIAIKYGVMSIPTLIKFNKVVNNFCYYGQ